MNLYQLFSTTWNTSSSWSYSPGILETLNMNGHSTLCNIEIHNTGSADLTGFVLQVRDHPEGEWYAKYLASDEWTSPGIGDKRFASGDPTTLAAGQRVHVHTRLSACWDFRFGATSNQPSTVTVRGGLFYGGV